MKPLTNKWQWLDALSRCPEPPARDHAPAWSPAYVRAVGLAITTWMKPDIEAGYCSASVAKIAERAGCSERQVRVVLDALELHQCIVRERSDGGSSRATCVIRLVADAFAWSGNDTPADDSEAESLTPLHTVQGCTPRQQAGQILRQAV